jgi:ATP-binding cassette subfamily C protein CydD
MRPVDPRLLRRPGMRRYLLATGTAGALAAILVIVQADAFARLLATAAQGAPERGSAGALAAALSARAVLGAAHGAVAARAAATVKADLRADLLAAALARGPRWLAGHRAGELATLVGRGVDALDAYLTGYLPQLVLAVVVPVAVLVRLAFADLAAALTVAATLPLLPVFGALVGWRARAATERQWTALRRLGGHFLDMIVGLPTLRVFGRASAQVESVRAMAEGYRAATMRALRVAFLSALVLELVATLSVALVAVPVGLRLLGGGLDLATALLVLLLAPEAYLPLRAAGARFHAAQEGLVAAGEAFAVLDRAATPAARRRVPDLRAVPVVFDDIAVRYADDGPDVLAGVSFTLWPGERIALVGPSGAGKSTLLALLLGFVRPARGRVLLGDTELSTVDIEAVRRQLAWVPQRPHLFAGTVADAIRLGAPDTPPEAVHRAAVAAHADGFVRALPHGYGTPIGERGRGLSDGQRQRLALARAFLRADAPLLLLDEPTARLDTASETAVLDASRRLLDGRTALVVAHRPALLTSVDRVLVVRDGRVAEAATAAA